MAITDRDNQIIVEWFEKYKYATIKQIEKAYMRDTSYSYNIVRKRFHVMEKAGFIKPYRDITTNRDVYIIQDGKTKQPSLHRIILLDILAEMKYNGFKIEQFKANEMFWCDGKYRSDGFVIFQVGKHRYHFFIEVQLANHDPGLKKYDALYNTGEVQKYLGKSLYPRILLISDVKYDELFVTSTEVVQLDTKLHVFPSIIIKPDEDTTVVKRVVK